MPIVDRHCVCPRDHSCKPTCRDDPTDPLALRIRAHVCSLRSLGYSLDPPLSALSGKTPSLYLPSMVTPLHRAKKPPFCLPIRPDQASWDLLICGLLGPSASNDIALAGQAKSRLPWHLLMPSPEGLLRRLSRLFPESGFHAPFHTS